MNTVMYSSKDWAFNQIWAYLWSFLSISAFVPIIFCNFTVKRAEIYHGKVKSYKSRSRRTRLEQQVTVRQTRQGSCYGVLVGHQYHPAKP